MISKIKITFIWILFLYGCSAQNLVSPCPKLFEYNSQGVVGNQWSGIIRLTLDQDLTGVWIKTIFDRPLLELMSDFGEVVQIDLNSYMIQRPSPKGFAGEKLVIRIFARFDPLNGVPEFRGLKMNSKTLCYHHLYLSDTVASPCPSQFTYAPFGPKDNIWHADISVESYYELEGIYVQLVFDKSPIHLGSDFGEIRKTDPTEFLVRDIKQKLEIGSVKQIRINVNYTPGEIPPKLLGFRISGRTVCPENNNIEDLSKLRLESPCPNYFRYNQMTAAADNWIGTITINNNYQLLGTFIELKFDKKPLEVLSDFGEVKEWLDPTEYIVRDLKYNLTVGTTLSFKISVFYKPGEDPVRLIGIKLSGSPICSNDVQMNIEPRFTSLNSPHLISPCPNLFTYEKMAENSNKWYGNINYKPTVANNHIQVHVALDREAIQLANWFNTVDTDDNKIFSINVPSQKLQPDNSLKMRLYVEFDPKKSIPKLMEIKINGKSVCS